MLLVLLEWGPDVNERLVLNARCVLGTSLHEVDRQHAGHWLISSVYMASHISHVYTLKCILFLKQQQACSS